MNIDINDQEQVRQWVQGLIESDNLHEFYTSQSWLNLRAEVLKEDKYECQRCKREGFYEPANTVHHVNPLRKHPELALSKYFYIDRKAHRNLESVSHECHELLENRNAKQKEPLTEERW